MKLTTGRWGGKNKPGKDIALEIKGEENFMQWPALSRTAKEE